MTFIHQHAHPKRDALQNQYDLLAEKLKQLRHDFAIQASTSFRFQLENEIKDVETELNVIENQLNDLERNSCSDRLYRALLKLGYRKQVKIFIKFTENNLVAAFLIHGCSPEYGQRWLLNKLIAKHVPKSIAGKVLRVDLNLIARKSDIAALWRELGYRVGLGRYTSPVEIAERVYQWWQTQNVLLIFYDVDCLHENYLQELIQDFWLPLANKTK